MRRALGAASLAVAAGIALAACSGSSGGNPTEPLQPGTAPAITSHVVPSSPAAAARRAASQTAHTTASPRKASATTAPTSAPVKGGTFCPASAHHAVKPDADGRKYICEQPSGSTSWRWLELPMWQSQHPSPSSEG